MIGAVLAMLALPVNAQQQETRCYDNKELLGALSKQLGEYLTGWGLSHRGYVIQKTVNEETGSFTVIGLLPNGCAVILDGGEAWVTVKKVIGGTGL